MLFQRASSLTDTRAVHSGLPHNAGLFTAIYLDICTSACYLSASISTVASQERCKRLGTQAPV
jgi:hypothetical protein